MKFENYSETEQHTLWLAKAALVAFMGDAHETAFKAVQRISDECGPDGVDLALLAWCDWMGAALGITNYSGPVMLQFGGMVEGGTIGQVTGADAVTRPEIVWAGRLIAARIAHDKDTYTALIETMPREPREVGRHVAAVLEVSALSMRTAGVTP